MVDRVEKLEKAVNEQQFEMRLINKTLSDVSETLKEIKDLNRNLVDVKNSIAIFQHEMNDTNKKIEKLFQYHDENTRSISSLKTDFAKADTATGLKLTFGEKIWWGIVSIVVSVVGFLWQASKQ